MELIDPAAPILSAKIQGLNLKSYNGGNKSLNFTREFKL